MGDNGPKVRWPPEIELFLSDREIERTISLIEITSPRNNASYIMGNGGGKILLNSKGGEGEIYWFANGGLCPPAEGSGEVW